MPQRILLDRSLSWRQVGDVAEGAELALSDGARDRDWDSQEKQDRD